MQQKANQTKKQEITYAGLQDEIPDGANRIILEQGEMTPIEVYMNALNYFQRAEWEVIASKETEDIAVLEDLLGTSKEGPLAFAVEEEITDNLALRIAINVEPAPAGGRLIASVDYPPCVAILFAPVL